MNVTRRFFVFGSAAAVAVAALPKVIAPPIALEEIVLCPAAHVYKRRAVYDIAMGFEVPQDFAEDHPAIIRLMRGDNCLKAFGMNVRGNMRWCVWDDSERIIMTPESTIRIDVEFPLGRSFPAQVHMMADDTIDEGPPVKVCEFYKIVDGKPEVKGPLFIDTDNSLEARLERKRLWEERRIAELTNDFDDDYDDDDVEYDDEYEEDDHL